LLNSSRNQDFSVKRRWDDDVVFKNQARGTEDKKSKEFVNDLLRSDFHKRFMVFFTFPRTHLVQLLTVYRVDMCVKVPSRSPIASRYPYATRFSCRQLKQLRSIIACIKYRNKLKSSYHLLLNQPFTLQYGSTAPTAHLSIAYLTNQRPPSRCCLSSGRLSPMGLFSHYFVM
jgi:hypothetical protein